MTPMTPRDDFEALYEVCLTRQWNHHARVKLTYIFFLRLLGATAVPE